MRSAASFTSWCNSHDGPAGIVERGIVRTVALDVARELVARQ
jgi:hypothetical protein